MTTPFFSTLDRIDDLLKRDPATISVTGEVEPLVTEEAARKYFYEHVNDGAWLDLLHQAGVFDFPPPAADGAYRTRWYPSEMLARLAQQEPARVLQIILEMPQADNPSIHNDLLAACLNLPPQESRRFLQAIVLWYRQASRPPDPESAANLAEKWLRSGCVPDGLTLLGYVLDVSPGRRRGDGQPGDRIFSAVDLWQYEEIIRKTLLPLAPRVGVIVDFLANLLQDAISRETLTRWPSSASYLWQPSLDGGVGHSEGLRSILTQALVEAYKQRIAETPETIGDAVSALDARGWNLYRRISLHLLRIAAESGTSAVAVAASGERLGSAEYLHNYELQREYARLLKAVFSFLQPTQRQEILSLLEAGPAQWYTSTTDRPTADEVHQHRQRWLYNWLSLLDGQLPPDWQQLLDKMRDEFGGAHDLTEPSDLVDIRMGPHASKFLPEMSNMEPEEVVSYLKGWSKWDDEELHTRGRAIRAAVAEDPAGYAQVAAGFTRMHPELIYSFLLGIDEAIRNESNGEHVALRDVAWEPVLDLCEALVARDIDREPATLQSWTSVLSSIASVFNSAFGASIELTGERINQARSILLRLVQEPDPALKREDGAVEGADDPYLTAINSVRGQSLEATIRFGLWRRSSLRAESKESSPNLLHLGLREALDEQLDAPTAPSDVVSSVFGRWYPWLLLLDEEWTTERTDLIFPEEERDQVCWEAAFGTYLRFCPAYDAALPHLVSQYRRAITALGERQREACKNLSSHLMIYYWRGKLDLSPDGLLHEFFENATPSMRSGAIEFVGRSLANTEADDIPEAVLKRLEDLWNWRLEHLRSRETGQETSGESSAFLTWYPPGHFSEEWVLERLLECFALEPTVGFRVHRLLDRLAGVASTYPVEAAQIVANIVRLDRESPRSRRWYDQLRSVIETVAGSESFEVRGVVADTVDQLGRQGALEFRAVARNL